MEAYRDQYATLFHGGKDVVLLAISADSASGQASWAAEKDFPFTFLSDVGIAVGTQYGAALPKYKIDNRTVFVIDPEGKISHVIAPFRETDPTAYTELTEAITAVAGPPPGGSSP